MRQSREQKALRVALAWLAHPVSVAAIAVLLLNDHVLKAEFGTWWTGKLSDVAGLMFAPALLAMGMALVIPTARPRAVAAASLATVGLRAPWPRRRNVRKRHPRLRPLVVQATSRSEHSVASLSRNVTEAT